MKIEILNQSWTPRHPYQRPGVGASVQNFSFKCPTPRRPNQCLGASEHFLGSAIWTPRHQFPAPMRCHQSSQARPPKTTPRRPFLCPGVANKSTKPASSQCP
ncbi:hypothetical protein PIB30_022912 [Stylosanthes scabra]|uniref:Uncharacterized protein n=1 Tax=Stylosanthes scabra TaxID=79078 RepID=A0ABU6Z7M0_9FABA|nr:hypothetical protein [Stylosanthes scabra]